MGRPMLLLVHIPGHVLCADLRTLPGKRMADNFVGISNYALRDLFATITRADLKAQPRDQGLTQ